MARDEGLEVMRPELGTQAARLLPQPLALFEMLHRRHALGGGQRRRRLRRGRAACGSRKDGRTVAETTSDNYGDFKFDKLDEDSGAYVVEISAEAAAREPSRPSSAPASISARYGCLGCIASCGLHSGRVTSDEVETDDHRRWVTDSRAPRDCRLARELYGAM